MAGLYEVAMDRAQKSTRSAAHRSFTGDVDKDIDEGIASLLMTASRCLYCGRKLRCLEEKALDHIFSIHLGGYHALENLTVACEPCNRRKCYSPVTSFLHKQGLIYQFYDDDPSYKESAEREIEARRTRRIFDCCDEIADATGHFITRWGGFEGIWGRLRAA